MLSEVGAWVVHALVHSSVQSEGFRLRLEERSCLDKALAVSWLRAFWNASTSAEDAKARGSGAGR